MFILLAFVGSQICEIPREFELMPVQGHPSSSLVQGCRHRVGKVGKRLSWTKIRVYALPTLEILAVVWKLP